MVESDIDDDFLDLNKRYVPTTETKVPAIIKINGKRSKSVE